MGVTVIVRGKLRDFEVIIYLVFMAISGFLLYL